MSKSLRLINHSILFGILLAAPLAFVSCDARHSDSASSEIGTPAADVNSFTSVTPISDFLLNTKSGQNAAAVIEDRVAECMRKKAWSYESGGIKDRNGEPSNPQALLEWRKRYGYGILNMAPPSPGAKTARQADDRQQKYVDSLSSSAKARYLADLGTGEGNEGGLTAGGCRASSETAVKKTFPAFNDAIRGDVGEKQLASHSDPAYLAASANWKTCMNNAGFSYNDPNDPAVDVSKDMSSAPTADQLAREIKIATADAQCSIDTIWPVQSKLEAKIVQYAVDKYGKEATCRGEC